MGSLGVPAVQDAPGLQPSCNLFWDNEYGPGYVLDNSDRILDPRFCSAPFRDYTLSSNSPALPEFSFGCGLIGAFDVGCTATSSRIYTYPTDLVVFVDGDTTMAAQEHVWTPGTEHEIGTLSVQSGDPGTRYVFEAWSDSGAAVHTVIAEDPPRSHAVSFRTEFLLTMGEDSLGTTTPLTGWQTRRDSVEILAIPDSGNGFTGWTGTGDGSYTGGSGRAWIRMNEAITQIPGFAPYRLMTMVAEPGGSVWPPTRTYVQGAVVPISATPDSAWGFTGWVGEGPGSYTGPEPEVNILIGGDITQTAYFAALASYPLTVTGGIGGVVYPPGGIYFEGTSVAIEATPDEYHGFVEWVGEGPGSYSGPSPAVTVTVLGPITQTAFFVSTAAFPLTILEDPGGTVWPPAGDYPAAEPLTLAPLPDPGHRFVGWAGSGEGSYTGTDSLATVFLAEPVTQRALFVPEGSGYEFTISASDSDPYALTSSPAGGVRTLYLWALCNYGGMASFDAGVSGTLDVLAFTPAAGLINFGSSTEIVLSPTLCITDPPPPFLLGSWVVWDDGGTLCFEPTSLGRLGPVDCHPQLPFLWSTARMSGFSSGAEPPCVIGTIACSGSPVSAPAWALLPVRTELSLVRPNPFRGSAHFDFALAAPGPVTFSIYDVSGRLVRTLLEGSMPAGYHTVDWDGRSGTGRQTAAGVYFARFRADDVSEVRKIVRLRTR